MVLFIIARGFLLGVFWQGWFASSDYYLVLYNYLTKVVVKVIAFKMESRSKLKHSRYIGNVLFLIHENDDIFVHDCREMIPKPTFTMNFSDTRF